MICTSLFTVSSCSGDAGAALGLAPPAGLTGCTAAALGADIVEVGTDTATMAGDHEGLSFKRPRRDMSTSTVRDRFSRSNIMYHGIANVPSLSAISMPSILPPRNPGETPIPLAPFAVLCLLLFGEFCSAGVSGPFVFFMVDSFIGGEGNVGFWAGMVSAMFFLAQFLTSLLWATAAARYGRRNMLQLSLVGSTVALILFGTSRGLVSAIVFRFAQGLFAGAVGVARGSARDLTDETNESRAYAKMGFFWGMGGIVGPIIGGVLEHPAQKYPWLFGKSRILTVYPYLLPCTVASLFTALGAVISLYMPPDEGAIQLGEDLVPENTSEYSHAMNSTAGRGRYYGLRNSSTFEPRRSVTAPLPMVNDNPSTIRQRHSYIAPEEDDHRLSLAERFVLANDDQVLSLTDLWVAAATGDESASLAEDEYEYEDEPDEYDDTPALFGTAFSGLYEHQQAAARAGRSQLRPAHFARMQRSQSRLSRMTDVLSENGEPSPDADGPVWSLMPAVAIVHYALLSFHSAAFEQVFMSFLVTPVLSGGLGLTAGHYATLIAFMALCQMQFQFNVYPNLAPPNGRFSHLSVLRIGLAIYLPCYALFPYLRSFIAPNSDLFVMVGMIAAASFRWLANVLSFTSVMVLLNSATPPALAPLAHGLAQTVSSAARFVGPIFGGFMWSHSVAGGVDTHVWPYNFHMGFLVVGLAAFCGFLHSLSMRSTI